MPAAEVRIDLTLNDRIVDLADEGYELAIRVGPLADSGLVARMLAPFHTVACASPAYLARDGKPKTPRDLTGHNCLIFSYATRGHLWPFQGPSGKQTISIKVSLQINSGAALRMAALEGLGIIMQPQAMVAEDIAAGRLARVLPRYESPPRSMHIVYLPDRRLSPKLRSFIDFLIERFGDD